MSQPKGHLVKEINPNRIQVLEKIYDRQYFVASPSSTRFFPPGTASGVIGDNSYQKNPLPGDKPNQIVGIGFYPTMAVIREDAANSIVLADIAVALHNAKLKLTIDSRTRQFAAPLSSFIKWKLGLAPAHKNAGTLTFLKIAGGAAGNHTVTGIAVGDELVQVMEEATASAVTTDLRNEFSVTAANTINNTGGTDTTGDTLHILYWDYATTAPKVPALILRSSGVMPTPDPFQLDPNVAFQLDVLWPLSAFPSAANWTASDQGGGGLGFRSVLQLGELKTL